MLPTTSISIVPKTDATLLLVCAQAAAPGDQDHVTIDVLCARAHALLAATDRSSLRTLVPAVTNELLERAVRAVWSLSSTDLKDWSKQRLVSLVVASISGGRLPSRDEAERPGQRIHEFIGRYKKRHRNLLNAEKAVVRRAKMAGRPVPGSLADARLAFEQEIFHCSYGCTPMNAPIRVVPPGKRPRTVEQVQTSIFEDNLLLRNENNALRELETSAVEVLREQLQAARNDWANSVLTEHASLCALDKERQRVEEAGEACVELSTEAKCMLREKRQLQEMVLSKEKENDVLGAKVARAHMDYSQALQIGGKEKQKLEKQLSSKEVSFALKQREMEDEVAKAREVAKLKDIECRGLQAKCLRLGGHIARLNREDHSKSWNYEKQVAKLQKTIHRLQEQLEAQKSVADHMRRLKNTMAERRRCAENRAATSERRLERAQEAEALLHEVQTAYDGLCEQMEKVNDQEYDDDDQSQCGRRDKRGRFQAEPASMRVLKWAQLARNVPTSAVNANIIEVLRIYAPDAIVPQPCERQMRKMRGEVTIAGEALAAYKIGKALRIVSFGFDESTKFGISLLSTNVQIEPHNSPGTILDVVPRGATIAAGGTAKKVSELVERKIFRHCRELLDKWRTCHDRKYGAGSWRSDGGPSLEAVGLHRLCENSLLMSDTCAAAEATKRLISEMAMEAAKEVVGADVWASMDEKTREAKYKVWLGDCHQHIRNIIINAMAKGATEHLTNMLSRDLAEFSSFDRMSVDGMDLIRAVFKELHASGEYAKGKGREFHKWCNVHHASFPLLPFERVAGSRQDLAFDGAVAIFWNRRIIIEFLHGLVHVPKASNILEKFLSSVLRCNEITALLRVCTVFKFVLSEPMRWLAGKGSSLPGWSIVSANEVLDLAYQALLDIASDGHTLFDPSLEPFAKIARKQPAFCTWHEEVRLARSIKSPDGESHLVYRLVLSEARSPEHGKGNAQATEVAVALAEHMAQQGLIAMRDPRRAIKEKLTALDGDLAYEKLDDMHARTQGAHTTNDRVEKNFAIYDVACRLFRNAPVENLSGITQQKTAHDFEMAPFVASDRRHAKAVEPELGGGGEHADGYFWTVLNERLRESLVEMARHGAKEATCAGREALKEQDLERLSRREERVVELLNKTVDEYAYAKELFQQWTRQRASTATEIHAAIRDKPEVRQLEYLRLQIEMRVLGLGWTEFSTRWSSNSDSNIGTVAHLRDLLIDAILPYEKEKERAKELPSEAQPPLSVPNALRKLGTLDFDAVEIEKVITLATCSAYICG